MNFGTSVNYRTVHDGIVIRVKIGTAQVFFFLRNPPSFVGEERSGDICGIITHEGRFRIDANFLGVSAQSAKHFMGEYTTPSGLKPKFSVISVENLHKRLNEEMLRIVSASINNIMTGEMEYDQY